MRRGGILAAAAALACAATASAQTPKQVTCGASAAPWRLSVAAPLTQRTCRTQIGLHGGTTRTVVRAGKRILLVLEAPAWYPPPGADRSLDTPLPLDARSQAFWHNGTRMRLRVLEQSAATRAVVRSLRFVR